MVEGWKKVKLGEGYGKFRMEFENINHDRLILDKNTLHSEDVQWCVYLLKRGKTQTHPLLINQGKDKAKALRFATNWMRKHPKG